MNCFRRPSGFQFVFSGSQLHHLSILALQFKFVWLALIKTGRGVICIPLGRWHKCIEWHLCWLLEPEIQQMNVNSLYPFTLPSFLLCCVCRALETPQVHGRLSSVPRLLSTSSTPLFTLMSSSWCKVGWRWCVRHTHVFSFFFLCMRCDTAEEGHILLALIELWSQSRARTSIWRQNKIKRSEGRADFRLCHVSSRQKLFHELHLAISLLKDQTEKSGNNAPKLLIINIYLIQGQIFLSSCTSELQVQIWSEKFSMHILFI